MLNVRQEFEKAKTESSMQDAHKHGLDPRDIMKRDMADGGRNIDAVKTAFARD